MLFGFVWPREFREISERDARAVDARDVTDRFVRILFRLQNLSVFVAGRQRSRSQCFTHDATPPLPNKQTMTWKIAVAAVLLALLAALIWLSPRCKPGDTGFTLGHMLLAGCRE
jgi:hypothetical protein